MTTQIYTLYDRVASQCENIWHARNDPDAQRSFLKRFENRKDFDDFALLHIGEFDHDTGNFYPLDIPDEIPTSRVSEEEIRHDKTARFMTMTFSDEELHKLEEEQNQHKVKVGIKKTITLKNGKTRNIYKYKTVERPKKLKGYNLDNAAAKRGVRKFLERWRKKEGTSVQY